MADKGQTKTSSLGSLSERCRHPFLGTPKYATGSMALNGVHVSVPLTAVLSLLIGVHICFLLLCTHAHTYAYRGNLLGH